MDLSYPWYNFKQCYTTQYLSIDWWEMFSIYNFKFVDEEIQSPLSMNVWWGCCETTFKQSFKLTLFLCLVSKTSSKTNGKKNSVKIRLKGIADNNNLYIYIYNNRWSWETIQLYFNWIINFAPRVFLFFRVKWVNWILNFA